MSTPGSDMSTPQSDSQALTHLTIDGTLDLHTFAPADCREVLRAYIEAAAEAGLPDLRIIHGKGVGTLRTIVHTELARNPAVASFALADAAGGGWGATLVRLLPAARQTTPQQSPQR